MKTFNDLEGHVWTLEIVIGDIPRIYEETGIHLLRLDRPIEEEKEAWLDDMGQPMMAIQRLMLDLPILYRVIYSLVAEEAANVCPTPKEWGRRISKVHGAAYDAFFEELIDFFQNVRQTWMAASIEKQQQVRKAMERSISGVFDKVDPEAMAEETMRKVSSILGEKYGDTQESLESIRVPLRFVN